MCWQGEVCGAHKLSAASLRDCYIRLCTYLQRLVKLLLTGSVDSSQVGWQCNKGCISLCLS